MQFILCGISNPISHSNLPLLLRLSRKTSIFTTRQRTAHDGFVRSERRPVEFGRRTCTMSIQQELFL